MIIASLLKRAVGLALQPAIRDRGVRVMRRRPRYVIDFRRFVAFLPRAPSVK
jgi:hypothetical protein